MHEENPQIKAVAPVKKAYVKPTATKHIAASVIVGSGTGCGITIDGRVYFF